MEKWVTAKQGARMLGIDKRNFSKWACKYKIQRKPGKSNIWLYDLFSLHGASAPVMNHIDRMRRIAKTDLDTSWKGKPPETTEKTDCYPEICKSEDAMENEEGYFVKPNVGDFVETGTIQADKIKTEAMNFDKLTLAAYERAGIRQRATGTGPKKKQNSVLSFLDRVLMRVVKAEQKIQPDINRIGTMLVGLYLPLLFLILILLGGL